jgi:hypothetical protein
MTADQLKAAAAAQFEVATAALGSGVAFDIVQTSTIKARPGGPSSTSLIPITAGRSSPRPANTLVGRGRRQRRRRLRYLRRGEDPG